MFLTQQLLLIIGCPSHGDGLQQIVSQHVIRLSGITQSLQHPTSIHYLINLISLHFCSWLTMFLICILEINWSQNQNCFAFLYFFLKRFSLLFLPLQWLNWIQLHFIGFRCITSVKTSVDRLIQFQLLKCQNSLPRIFCLLFDLVFCQPFSDVFWLNATKRVFFLSVVNKEKYSTDDGATEKSVNHATSFTFCRTTASFLCWSVCNFVFTSVSESVGSCYIFPSGQFDKLILVMHVWTEIFKACFDW